MNLTEDNYFNWLNINPYMLASVILVFQLNDHFNDKGDNASTAGSSIWHDSCMNDENDYSYVNCLYWP